MNKFSTLNPPALGQLSNRNGFTLIELLIYMGLFSIMIFLITDVFFAALDVQVSSRSTSDSDQDSRYILNRLSYDIHNADTLDIPSQISSKSSTLELTKNGQNYTYVLDNGNLIMQMGSESSQLNGFDTIVSEVSFEKVGQEGKGTVVITYTVTSKTVGSKGADSVTNTTAVGLR